MKREFLQNFKVGDQPLSNEIIEAIMAENGRDVQAEQAKYADYESIKEQLQTAKDSLKSFEGVDVAQLQGEITKLNGQLAQKDAEWQGKLDDIAFDGVVKEIITKAGGRSEKAIRALLDLESLKASKNREADVQTAVDNLKKENDYLFGDEPTPPPYAGGTGKTKTPQELSKMSYSEISEYLAKNPGAKLS